MKTTPYLLSLPALLLFAGVVERPTRSTDPGGERRFGYGSPTPYRLKNVVSADDPVPVLEKKDE